MNIEGVPEKVLGSLKHILHLPTLPRKDTLTMSTKELPLSIVPNTTYPKAYLSLRTLPRMAFCPNTDAGGSLLSFYTPYPKVFNPITQDLNCTH